MALFETIKYRIVKRYQHIEIREYDNILLASSKNPLNPSQDNGFNDVFNYISGNNDKKTKISMTTPVVTYEEGGQLVTGFYVPSKFNKESVPKPVEKHVFINELKKSHYAVIKFNGKWNTKNFDQHDQILRHFINDKDMEILSQRIIMRYQPPFIPGILRRNEIAYQIKYKG